MVSNPKPLGRHLPPEGANLERSRNWFRRIFPARASIATIPTGVRVYAVGDIHGRLDLLEQMSAMILQDARGADVHCVIVYMGDYLDRGPDSKGVVDRLLAPTADGFEYRFIRGNHDQSLLDFLDDPSVYRIWKNYGAQETLLSYGVMPPRFEDESAFAAVRDALLEALPQAHLDFLSGLELSLEIGDYLFVHAGVRPGLPLERQGPEDLMWIRDDFLNSRANFGKVVVHGHTPTPDPTRRSNRIGVDTGAYATGKLSSVVLEGAECRFLHT